MRRYLLFALMLSGMMTSAQTSITNGSCKAQFKYEVNDKLMTLLPATAINFFDKSEGKVKEWYWDFGDGNTSREQNPMFVFSHPIASPNVRISPYRTVSLTILTSDTCKSFFSEMINIMDGSAYVKPVCKAGFKYYPSAYDSIGNTASFHLTNLSEGDSLKYSWQFDDGKTSNEKEPNLTLDLKQSGLKVCLTVTGTNKCTDTFCDAVCFTNPNNPNPIDTINAECKTYFGYKVNYDIKTFTPALVLDFYSKTSSEATEWKWDFGDGSSSDKANPTHIFNLPLIKESTKNPDNGDRKVCLAVRTVSGCTANHCETINIYNNGIPIEEPQCHAWFKYYKPIDVITIPELSPYKLVDASEGKVIKRLWQFEDGKTSTDAEPLVNFDITRPIQKVCLTIYTSDSCMSTWCDAIYVSDVKPDTAFVPKPELSYTMHYISSFPVQMSSCAGYVKAQVYLKDSLIKADGYVWSTGAEGQELKNLCPTETYTVKAKIPDGIYVTGTFVFNSDGTVTELPINWWITGKPENPIIQYALSNKEYTVEWRLCDGTIVKSDSIPLNSINCGTKESNLILKDNSGKIVYTENISRNSIISGINNQKTTSVVKLFPNPVTDLLNIQYSGNLLSEMKIEIYDNSGKRVSMQIFYDVASGQRINLNVSSLRKGIYICKMISGNRIIGIEKFSK